MARGKHSRGRFRRAWLIGLVAAGVVLVVGAGTAFAAYGYDRSRAERILPGISIDGVSVGGMTRDEAIRTVSARADTSLGGVITVTAGGSSWQVTPEALGTRADVAGAVDQAFAAADHLSLLSRVYHRLTDRPVDTSIMLGYAIDRAKIMAFVQQASDEVATPAVDAGLALDADNQLVQRRSQPGEALNTKSSVVRIAATVRSRETSARLSVDRVQPSVTATTLGKTIVVDLSENELYLYDGFRVIKKYPVATAAPGYTTPVGTWSVVNKVENPAWYNPAPDGWGAGEPLYIPPGYGNPLGTRALYLNAPGIRIHGTYASYSIGTYASHGCIRMLIADSEELYPLVPVGTPVLIKP